MMPLSNSAAPKLSHTRLLLMTGAAPLVLALVLVLELVLAPLLSSPWTGGAVRGGNSLVGAFSVIVKPMDCFTALDNPPRSPQPFTLHVSPINES